MGSCISVEASDLNGRMDTSSTKAGGKVERTGTNTNKCMSLGQEAQKLHVLRVRGDEVV